MRRNKNLFLLFLHVYFGAVLMFSLSGCASMSEVGEGMMVGGMANPGNPLSATIAGAGMLIHSIGKNLPQDSGETESNHTGQLRNSTGKLTRSGIRAQFQRSLPKEDISDQALHEHAIAFCKDFDKEEHKQLFYGSCVDDVEGAGEEAILARRSKRDNVK